MSPYAEGAFQYLETPQQDLIVYLMDSFNINEVNLSTGTVLTDFGISAVEPEFIAVIGEQQLHTLDGGTDDARRQDASTGTGNVQDNSFETGDEGFTVRQVFNAYDDYSYWRSQKATANGHILVRINPLDLLDYFEGDNLPLPALGVTDSQAFGTDHNFGVKPGFIYAPFWTTDDDEGSGTKNLLSVAEYTTPGLVSSLLWTLDSGVTWSSGGRRAQGGDQARLLVLDDTYLLLWAPLQSNASGLGEPNVLFKIDVGAGTAIEQEVHSVGAMELAGNGDIILSEETISGGSARTVRRDPSDLSFIDEINTNSYSRLEINSKGVMMGLRGTTVVILDLNTGAESGATSADTSANVAETLPVRKPMP